jgi:hypothetical protein
VARRIVLALSHSIEEHDQLKLLHGLGHEVFSIGGYINPAEPHDDKRPALSDVPHYPDLQAAVDAIGSPDNLGAAQELIPDAILDWADTIIYHHYLDRLYGQWSRIRDWLRGDANRRVIWRSVGQSVEGNERTAVPFRKEGLERVAYSPKEQNIPGYAGHDALIRFYKDPEEWSGWTGEDPVVINFTQHLRQRDPYTLGLIEAMMTGIPVVSIGPKWMNVFPYGPLLFEGHEIAAEGWNSPGEARQTVEYLLANKEAAVAGSEWTRNRAIELFGKDEIAAQWAEYLG